MDERLHFLTDDYKIADICDDYISLTYTESFRSCGEFECVLSMSRRVIPKEGDVVLCGERLVYIIESICRDTAKGTVTLKGKGILSYFGRRIVSAPMNGSLRCELLIGTLVNIYGTDAVPGTLAFEYPAKFAIADIAVEEGNLLSAIEEIAETWNLGLSLRYDFDAEKFIFSVPPVCDRCIGNTEGNAPIFLSEGFDTIESSLFTRDLSGYVNSVTVRGGEKEDGTFYTTTVFASDFTFDDGFDDSLQPIRESFVRSGIGMGIYMSENSDGTEILDEDAYLKALATRGRTELARYRPRGEISASVSYDTVKDIAVGDRCTLFSPATDVESVTVTEKRCDIFEGNVSYSVLLAVS